MNAKSEALFALYKFTKFIYRLYHIDYYILREIKYLASLDFMICEYVSCSTQPSAADQNQCECETRAIHHQLYVLG